MEDEIKEIKKDIRLTFGENFYNTYIENSNGISGIRYIRENITPKEITEIYLSRQKESFKDFEEKSRLEPFFENVLLTFELFRDTFLKIEVIEQNWEPSFLENFDKIEKEFILRLNLKMKTNYDRDALYSDERVKKELLDKMRVRWQKAYQENYKQSLDQKFWKFEENLVRNVFLKTIEYF